MTRLGLHAAAAAIMAMTAGGAAAQAYPSKTMTMVVPFAAGGPTDVLGRVVAQRLGEIMGQQVIVENIAGAGGTIGSKRVSTATPDGHTMVLGTVGTHAQSQTLFKTPAYNAAEDFTPVALIAEVPLVLIARKDLPAADFKGFMELVKREQDKMSFATAGPGSAVHLGCELLNAALGVKARTVHYRGSAPAMQDLIGGRVDYMCEIVSTALPQITGGAVKPLATLTLGRSSVVQDLPTAHESGLPNFEAYTWNAIFLPKGTPAPIVETLQKALVATMRTPAVRERLQSLGASLVAESRESPEYLGRFVRSEIEKWAKPILASGAQQ